MPIHYSDNKDYGGPWVYIRGPAHGLVGPGAVIIGARDIGDVVKDNYYTVDEIVQTDLGNCSIHSRLKVEGSEHIYHKNDFRLDYCCLEE